MHPIIRRGSLWLFALALLLKAAVPMLASAAAEVQGKTLVEVCTVYGVKTVAVDGEPQAPHEAGHAAEHCALGGVLTAGIADAPTAFAPRAAASCTVVPTPMQPRPAPPDDCARFVAQLKHGPPALA